MSAAEIAGIVLGAIGAAAAVVHLRRSIWRRLKEERRWHCAFGGRMRYCYHAASIVEYTADDEMVNRAPSEENDALIDWLGEWVECSRLCNASRSGVCRENPIFTRHILKILFGAICSCTPLRLRSVQEIKWMSTESIAFGDPHPVTGKYSPTTMVIISRYREELAPDASGNKDQSDSQSESAS